MAANTIPIVPITQNIGSVTLTTADTSLTSPTTAGATALTAGANGTRIDGMKVRALGTNVATVLRVFIKTGGSYALFYEVALPASTASTTAPAEATDLYLLPVNYDNGAAGNSNGVLPPYLKSGQSLVVSLGTTVAAGYAVTAWGGDY